MTADDITAAARRRREVVIAGHMGDSDAIRAGLTDEDETVRAAALGAAQRAGVRDLTLLIATAAHDASAVVRRRAADVAATQPDIPTPVLLHLLADGVEDVVETTAWACGELARDEDAVVMRLVDIAIGAESALVRESAIAALGAIGDPRGLPAILRGCSDKPAVRRRAVLALAPFEGPEVDAALARAREDRDWQVRQSAEDVSPPIR